MIARDKLRIELRGVVYPEDDFWIAHCLEMDVVAEGASPQEAVRNVIDLCACQIEEATERGDPELIFHPAPSRFWRMYFSIPESRITKHPARSLEQFEVRELVPA